MVEDNTPTVTRRRREPASHLRLRLETAKRLRLLGEKAKVRKQKRKDETAMEVTVKDIHNGKLSSPANASVGVKTRIPRVKKNALRTPDKPSAKFRKRQMNKTWLPTHIYHSKRAIMTAPKEPLWRFAIPLTPTMKGYRPTHKASTTQGAVAWDMSYMSTVGLEGVERSLQNLLEALAVGAGSTSASTWEKQGHRWLKGSRVWSGWLHKRGKFPAKPISPVTIIWCPQAPAPETNDAEGTSPAATKQTKRKIFMRVHPSTFLQVWDEVLRLSKVQKPAVTVEDLRFEIGSIELVGPQSTEALVAILQESTSNDSSIDGSRRPASIWSQLAPTTNPASLPLNAILAFETSDPRLHFPSRAMKGLHDPSAHSKLLQYCAEWPLDDTQCSIALFDRAARLAAARGMRSQKSIGRRKAMAKPGSYPQPLPTDPQIPVLAYVTRGDGGSQATWNVLLPWKCVGALWRSLMFYPLSTGGQVRLGGLREKRQIAFEAGLPWFPGDYPGTEAGSDWEEEQRKKRKIEWEKKPKGKRVQWESVPIRKGRKGEVGIGWACDWEHLFFDVQLPPSHIPRSVASEMLRSQAEGVEGADGLVVVKITLLTKDVPQTCARLYSLPTTDDKLRKQWLEQVPSPGLRKRPTVAKPPRAPPNAPTHIQNKHLAASLLDPMPPNPGNASYPEVPGEEDLFGFVTTGNFNLAEGKGIGIGSIRLSKAIRSLMLVEAPNPKRLCIVRDAGQSIGRLAKWEHV